MSTINNKRKFYRIKLNKPICMQMTISCLYGKQISMGYSNVCVKDIGPGGLLFVSNLLLPVDKNITYLFKFTLFDKQIILNGTIVRRIELENNIYHYGIMLNIDKCRESDIIQILNKLTFLLNRNPYPDTNTCSFCKDKTCPYYNLWNICS